MNPAIIRQLCLSRRIVITFQFNIIKCNYYPLSREPHQYRKHNKINFQVIRISVMADNIEENDDLNIEVIEAQDEEETTCLVIDDLNDDCLLEIFQKLSIRDLINVENVCLRWDEVSYQIWKLMRSVAAVKESWYFSTKNSSMYLDYISNHKDVKAALNSCGAFIKILDLSYLNWDRATVNFVALIVLPKCPNIREFIVRDPLEEPVLKSLAENGDDLEVLSIDNMDPDGEECLADILQRKTKLKYFIAKYGTHGSRGTFLDNLSDSIEKLSLERFRYLKPDYFNRAVNRFKNLCSLTLDIDPGFEKSMLESISHRTTLKQLSLRSYSQSYMEPKSFQAIGSLINLTELSIKFNLVLNDENLIYITDNCKQLELLDVSYCDQLTNEGIQNLEKCERLKTLNINGLSQISDAALALLPRCLEVLLCWSCHNVQDSGVVKLIRRAPRLSHLGTFQCRITNTTILSAIDITMQRNPRVQLEIEIKHTLIDLNSLPTLPPHIKLITNISKIW